MSAVFEIEGEGGGSGFILNKSFKQSQLKTLFTSLTTPDVGDGLSIKVFYDGDKTTLVEGKRTVLPTSLEVTATAVIVAVKYAISTKEITISGAELDSLGGITDGDYYIFTTFNSNVNVVYINFTLESASEVYINYASISHTDGTIFLQGYFPKAVLTAGNAMPYIAAIKL